MRVLICLLLMSSLVFADNTSRIKELEQENTKLSNEISQAQEYIRQREIQRIKNIGAIEALQQLDVETKEQEHKTE